MSEPNVVLEIDLSRVMTISEGHSVVAPAPATVYVVHTVGEGKVVEVFVVEGDAVEVRSLRA